MSNFESFPVEQLTVEQFENALQHQLPDLSGVLAGITRQILGQGLNTLSEKQKYRFDNDILPSLTELCRCGCRVVAGIDYCDSCKIKYNL